MESHAKRERIERILRWLRRGLDDPEKADKFISL